MLASTPTTLLTAIEPGASSLKVVQRPDFDGQDDRLDEELLNSMHFPQDKNGLQKFLWEDVLKQIGHLNRTQRLTF